MQQLSAKDIAAVAGGAQPAPQLASHTVRPVPVLPFPGGPILGGPISAPTGI